MKKTLLFVSLLVLTALACNMTFSVTQDNLPATQPVNTIAAPTTQAFGPATTTPEIFGGGSF